MYQLKPNWNTFEKIEDYLTEGGTRDFKKNDWEILWHWVRPALISLEEGVRDEKSFLYYKEVVKKSLYNQLAVASFYKDIYLNWQDPDHFEGIV